MTDGNHIVQELDDKIPYHTLSSSEIHDAVISAENLPATQKEPSAWCVVDPKGDILFLSKARHRADIFAEGTSNVVEPLYRKCPPSDD